MSTYLSIPSSLIKASCSLQEPHLNYLHGVCTSYALKLAHTLITSSGVHVDMYDRYFGIDELALELCLSCNDEPDTFAVCSSVFIQVCVKYQM